MSCSMWSYRPEVCDGEGCPGDCDLCDKPKNMEDEDEDMTDYIMDWRQEPLTKKQKELIEEMQEFSCFPIPKFTGKTKGEASDYIERYGKKAHENVDSPTWGY